MEALIARNEKNFIELFNTIEEVREDGKVLYPLNEILFLSFTAVLSCAESWSEIISYGNQHLNFLRKYMPFVNGIPSKSVLSRVFSIVDKKQMANFLLRFSSQFSVDDEIIALDGKRIRGSDIHLLNVFATKQGIVLAQKHIENKTNEIPEIPKILDELSIDGAVITADALNCQKSIAKKIQGKHADYFLAVKGNQKSLLQDIKAFFDISDKYLIHEDIDKGHGRIEVRKCCSAPVPKWLIESNSGWKGLNSICLIKSERHIKGKIEQQNKYYISSTRAEPRRHLELSRSHWGIENSLHWVLDVVFREDQSTLAERAANNMAVLRKLIINIIKKYKANTGDKTAVKTLRKMASWSNKTTAKLLRYLVNN